MPNYSSIIVPIGLSYFGLERLDFLWALVTWAAAIGVGLDYAIIVGDLVWTLATA